MSVKVTGVRKLSSAFFHGIHENCIIEKINDHDIVDVLDYDFYMKEKKLVIVFTDEKGRRKKTIIHKKPESDIGLEFETYLMDKQQSCKNKCVFCFVDQMPKGMRETLYFKDDDSRLSFLTGSYITLTNLSEREVERIIEMHISPINISVHTMNPELRVQMMKHPKAGESLDIIRRFAEAGISMNTQLVLCPGINDGKELEYSLSELSKYYPAVQSIAAVPVGLTKHREGLCPLQPYIKETASAVIDTIECFSDHFLYFNGTRLAFAADEFYLKAERAIPDASFYEDFSQIENGVGMWASLREEFYSALSEETDFKTEKRHLSIATGDAAYPLLNELAKAACEKFENITVNVYRIINNFFGESVTVAGLIVGEDLIAQLKDKDLGDELLIPSVMLRFERDMFLDNVTVEEAEKALNIKITPSDSDGYKLLNLITGR